jgi:hypothetical protein
MAYEYVDVLAEWAGGMRFDDLLDGAAGVECLNRRSAGSKWVFCLCWC